MTRNKYILLFFWTVILLLSVWFYFDNAIAYLFGYRSDRFGETFFHNQFWFVTHMLGATCSLFLGPVQFWKRIRIKFPKYHRLAGKIYIIGSLVAAVSAFRLSLIYNCVGCRYSLVILSVLFFLTTCLAWFAIKQRNILLHRQFMIRSYTCALAFVFIRLNQVIPINFIYDVIEDAEVRQVVNEMLFSLGPLFLVEVFFVWLPSLNKKYTRN